MINHPLHKRKNHAALNCWVRPLWHELLDPSHARLETRTLAENWLAGLSEEDQIIGCIENE